MAKYFRVASYYYSKPRYYLAENMAVLERSLPNDFSHRFGLVILEVAHSDIPLQSLKAINVVRN